MKSTQLISIGLVAVAAAACGGTGTAKLATKQVPQKQPAGNTQVAATGSAGSGRCTTGQLSVRLGAAGGAAGSVYEPIVFTNKGSSTCTLNGYPGVAFVAPQSGKQVGAAASRDAQHAATSVSLAPGASASALLQVANHANYSASACHATSVSGLRVYPPGSTTAAYVPFAHTQQACASTVHQLSIRAVVAGPTGM